MLKWVKGLRGSVLTKQNYEKVSILNISNNSDKRLTQRQIK